MVTSPISTRNDIVSAIAQASGQDQAVIGQIFEHVAIQDLVERDPAYLGGAARHLVELATNRTEPTALEVFTPTPETHGWYCSRTIVQVCTPDSPFLVDSITEAISQMGYRVHLFIHPIMPSDAHSRDGDESWMHIEMTRLADEQAHAKVRDRLVRVLTDVAKAVGDWQAMRDQTLRVVEEFTSNPPPTVEPSDITLAGEFLTWLTHGHFTFLGYREYSLEEEAGGELVLAPVSGTALGILGHEPNRVSRLRPEAQKNARSPRLLTITKANSRATVHRSAYLDYIGIRTFDDAGNVTGERRLLGLFTSSAYAESVTQVPIVSNKVDEITRILGYAPTSHSGKDLLQVLETFPRDELFQDSAPNLAHVAQEVLYLAERRRSKIFVRADEFGRFVSVLVFMPRDRYSTHVRLKIEDLLRQAYGAATIDFTTSITESPLAQVHLVLRMLPGHNLPSVDIDALQADISEVVRSWDDRLAKALRHAHGEAEASTILSEYAGAFTPAYHDNTPAEKAVADIALLRSLTGPEDVRVRLDNSDAGRFRVASHQEFPLTQVMPVLTAFGVKVIDEKPFPVTLADGSQRHISDFGLELPRGTDVAEFEEGFRAVWLGQAESDHLNALITHAGVPWRHVVILRTLARYAHQVNPVTPFAVVEDAVVSNPVVSRGIVDLFDIRFNPERDLEVSARVEQAAWLSQDLLTDIETVRSREHDRALRLLIATVQATWRTNFYTGLLRGHLSPDSPVVFPVSLKLNPRAIEGMPEPRPMAEIWVYSPQVEGTHLRFAPVARGGLRWSDRPNDFRTEVLGLVKAQMVKNAVIVPGGSKGGFIGKQLPSPSNREAWVEAGKDAYRAFIRAMLDITDNRDGSRVIPPAHVVRHDDDDPYLVVAADKGTAAFSDVANDISQEYGFWLDDAFASGGSTGYDHKAMGITARGAWESAKRHFRELGVDIQNEPFTVVGIGDMSGDVFGNGMRQSRFTRLIAAFDHRHVFIDPNPDPHTSYEERERLYHLPSSSWADYNPDLISPGGGVFERGAKAVTITQQMRQALGLADDVVELTPTGLIRAALHAPVDLIYNGGIGTYIKASTETNAEIGDPAGDEVRVDAADLRTRVIVEGGNLGVSQRGRVEAARRGIAINTDAIDNSGGVVSSDVEVNLKLLFTDLIKDGVVTTDERNQLLQRMTDEVADQVVSTNYEQNVLLSTTLASTARVAPVHQRMIVWLEERGDVDRDLEALPSDDELRARWEHGEGLTRPELAAIVAYAKMALKTDLEQTSLAQDPWSNQVLADYFPTPVRERFSQALLNHPLRDNLIINQVANAVINHGGMTFAYRVVDETGADLGSTVRAFMAAQEIFQIGDYAQALRSMNPHVPIEVGNELAICSRRVLDRVVRWLLAHHPDVDVEQVIATYAPIVAEFRGLVPTLMVGDEKDGFDRTVTTYTEAGVDPELATWGASLLPLTRVLDVVRIAHTHEVDPHQVGRLFFRVAEHVGLIPLLRTIQALPQPDRWQSLARAGLRTKLYAALGNVVSTMVADAGADRDGAAADGADVGGVDVAEWFSAQGQVGEQALDTVAAATCDGEPNMALLLVAIEKLASVGERRFGG